jgi:LPXTG-motif cell wall-anchored protein
MDKFTLGVKNAAGQEITQLYDIKLLLNGQPIQPDGKVKITLKLTDVQKNYTNLQVVYIADDGKVTIIPCKINGAEVSFITDHFSYYGITGTPVKSSDGRDNPKTGDETPIIPNIIIVFLSATVLAVFTKKKKYRVIKK